MTTIPVLPRQNYYGSVAALWVYGAMAIVVAIVGFDEGAPVGVVALAIHLLLTLASAAVLFRWLWARFRRRWSPTVAKPPEREAHVVLEGRLGAGADGFRSPFSGGSCVAWGLVDESGGQDSPHRFRWVIGPFVLEDPRGHWRAQIRPSLARDRSGPNRQYMPDLGEAIELGGKLCKPEVRRAIEEAAAALPEPLRWHGAVCPLYGFELREGDRVVLRGRLIPGRVASGSDDATPYDLEDWSLERGTAEEVASRRGSHWYSAVGVAIALGSVVALAVIGLGAWAL